MTADERVQVTVEIIKAAETFGEALSDTRVPLYLEALDDLPADALLWTLREARKRLKWFPKPAELREMLEGSPDDRATRAWVTFLDAIERHGTYGNMDFGDRALHATIEALGGWHEAWRIERLDAKEQGFKRAEFLKLYTTFSRQLPARAPRELVGQHALTNAATRSSWTRGLMSGAAAALSAGSSLALPPAEVSPPLGEAERRAEAAAGERDRSRGATVNRR